MKEKDKHESDAFFWNDDCQSDGFISGGPIMDGVKNMLIKANNRRISERSANDGIISAYFSDETVARRNKQNILKNLRLQSEINIIKYRRK